MPERFWFPLAPVAALAAHATDHPAGEPADPILTLHVDDGVRLHAGDGSCDPRACPEPVYADGCGPDTDATVQGETATLRLDGHVCDGQTIGERIRAGLADGARWLSIERGTDARLTPAVVHRRPGMPGPGAVWIPALVEIPDLLGPYPALVADGFAWNGFVIACFTLDAAHRIAADTAALARRSPEVDVVRVHADHVDTVSTRDGGEAYVEPVPANPLGMFPVGAMTWCWERADPPAGGDPRRPWPCTCPDTCAACHQPVGGPHRTDCPWREQVRHHRPRIPVVATVLDAHRHRAGCPHTTQQPGPLFTPVGGDGDEQCGVCAAVNTCDRLIIDPSYGGTVEYFERCTHCDTSRGHLDMSAVI